MAERLAIRPARRDDVGELAAIEAACFPDPWSEAAFAGLLDATAISVWVAAADDLPRGYLVVQRAADTAEILNLAVTPGARRQGLAGRLLERGLRFLQRAGSVAVFLEVRRSNRPAIKLYSSHGFTLVGVRRGYYRTPLEDALVLRRRFSSAGENDPRRGQSG